MPLDIQKTLSADTEQMALSMFRIMNNTYFRKHNYAASFADRLKNVTIGRVISWVSHCKAHKSCLIYSKICTVNEL